MTWDLPASLPIREEGVLRIFIALKKSIALAGSEPATFGSSGKHTNTKPPRWLIQWVLGVKRSWGVTLTTSAEVKHE
jgi:hypothetical protein